MYMSSLLVDLYGICYHFLWRFLSKMRKIEDLRLMVILMNYYSRGGYRISGKGHMYKGMGVGFADLISFFLNIP